MHPFDSGLDVYLRHPRGRVFAEIPRIVDILQLERLARGSADADGLERLRTRMEAAREVTGGTGGGPSGWMGEVERELRKWMP